MRVWQPGDNGPADYALVRSPSAEMLQGRATLRGLFALGAGVDDILEQLQQHPELLPDSVPLYRLEDTGMARQMQEYAVHSVLNWFRRFDDYRLQQQQQCWQPLPAYRRESFTVGILGAGVLGQSVAESLKPWGFPIRVWSRSPKEIDGVTSFAGRDALPAFLQESRVVINLLPSTHETINLIDQHFYSSCRTARSSSTSRVAHRWWKRICWPRSTVVSLKRRRWMCFRLNRCQRRIHSGHIRA